MRMKKTPMGAKRTIWSRELTATRIAQYSLSPPASPVQTKTCERMGELGSVAIDLVESTHHSNASCKPNNDQPLSQLWFIRQESPGQCQLNEYYISKTL